MEIKSFFKKSLVPLGLVGSIGGFIGDVLKPFANFGFIFLMISLAGLIITGGALLYFKKKEGKVVHKEKWVAGCIFFALFALMWGIYIPIANAGPPQGYLADNIDAISKLQTDVLKIGEDVTEIKGDVKKIDSKLDNITAKITQVDLNGGIISDPRTPQEWYSNAVLYKLKGMNEDAIKAFEKFFNFNIIYVDPYLQYIEVAKNVKGTEYLNDFFTRLSDKYTGNQTVRLMKAKINEDRNVRIKEYEKIYSEGDPSAPLLYMLITEYSYANLPQASMLDRSKEVIYLDALTGLPVNKQLKEYFVSADMLTEAQKTLQTETNLNKTGPLGDMIKNPVQVQMYSLGTGEYSIVFISTDYLATNILYRIDGNGEFTDTGENKAFGMQTSQRQPKTDIQKKLSKGEHKIEVKYIVKSGEESKVYEYIIKAE
ncbi:MAG TPA: hypothetical protein PKC91_10610 [Ignavibacteria bacterium]|nr:hypothetical protein [Ignavibacteria bacterium]